MNELSAQGADLVRACGIGGPSKYHAATVSDGTHGPRPSSLRVLIVDDEVNLRYAIERRLRNAGIAASSASTVGHAKERIRTAPFDVVLCDLRMPGGGGEELLRWLAAYSPSTRAVVVSAFITEEFKKTFPSGDNLHHLEKPVDLDGLVVLLEQLGPRRGFYGNSIEVELFDYVQMIALTGRDKLIEVVTPKGNGLIWFEHGDIVHVEYGDFRGEMAFYRLLGVNRGTFHEVFLTEPPKRTVQRSSTHLLMEAARMADEGTLSKLGQEPEVEQAPIGEPAVPSTVEDETSFESLNDDDAGAGIVAANDNAEAVEELSVTDLHEALPDEDDLPDADELFAEPPRDAPTAPTPVPPAPTGSHRVVPTRPTPASTPAGAPTPVAASDSAALPGHALFEDPDTRQVMLEQFWQFEGINGVAIISSTGKVLAEDMRNNSSMVTLAGFYMRGAARLARTLGYNVFDGVVARSMNGQQMVMVSMGAASAVLSVEPGRDPEHVRDAVMGVE